MSVQVRCAILRSTGIPRRAKKFLYDLDGLHDHGWMYRFCSWYLHWEAGRRGMGLGCGMFGEACLGLGPWTLGLGL